MVNLDNSAGPLVPKFYAGRNVFITGATGFMGKVLVERLLATCPDISRLYLLMREKNGLSPMGRLQELKESPVFDVIRVSCPQQLEKIIAVSGDVTLPDLGMSEEDRSIIKDVSLVFHIAATVKLQEELKLSVDQNLRSVLALLELCDTLPIIDAFIHTSTAYCNAELSTVEEKVYPPPMDLDKLLQLVDSQEISIEECRRITACKPNTYTFTKAMSEHVLEQHGCQRYPIAIFRPSIVISSMRNPFPGWIENLNGPSGVICGAGTGLLRVMRADDYARADMIPVDLAMDTMIVAAFETATDKLPEVRVYNCTSNDNPTTWGHFRKVINSTLPLYPSVKAIMYPHIIVSENRYIYKIIEAVLQTIPLHLIQYMTKVLGVKTINLIKANQKLKAMNHALQHFATREWNFETKNVEKLIQRMTKKDKTIFNIEPKSINWDELFTNFIKGSRKYILKEPDTTIDKARKVVRRLNFFYTTVKVLLTIIAFRLMSNYISLQEQFSKIVLFLKRHSTYILIYLSGV